MDMHMPLAAEAVAGRAAGAGARLLPHVREAGSGPAVVCLHCNGATAAQWGALMVLLAPRYRVLAPDLWGAGFSPRWQRGRPRTLDDEVDLIEPVLEQAGPGAVLVGHSYGAAIALVAALRHPGRIRALALYEPTLFSLIDQAGPAPNAADGIRRTVRDASEALDRGDADAAGRLFIDYWTGPRSWERMPAPRRHAVAAGMADLPHWGHALLKDPRAASAFAGLKVPVLYMSGSETPASAAGVAQILTAQLPLVRHRVFRGLGHMGPLTDPGTVHEALCEFLLELDPA